MITASVSWTVMLYPALARSRQFARRVSVLLEAEQRSGLSVVRELGVPLLLEFVQAILQYRVDIILFPVLLNFYATERESVVAYVLPDVLRFAREAADCEDSAVRAGGLNLLISLEILAKIIAEHVVPGEDRSVDDVFVAFKLRES
jgi:hypothetical protein